MRPQDEAPEKRRERLLAQRICTEIMWRPKIPQVHKVDYEHFKNRYNKDKQDYAIEALVGPPSIRSQIQEEWGRRRQTNPADPQQLTMLAAYGIMGALHVAENGGVSKSYGGTSKSKSRVSESELSSAAKDSNIHRVRIQSQPILGHLTHLMGEDERRARRSWPRTFFRPFKAFIYFQSKMKGRLAELEKRWKESEEYENEQSPQLKVETDLDAHRNSTAEEKELDAISETSEPLESVASSSDDNMPKLMDKVMDSTEALRDMRCYVDFVDKEIMPRHDLLQGNEPQKVSFDDLWSLFRLGELVYVPTGGDNGEDHDQELWRLYRVGGPSPSSDIDSNGPIGYGFGGFQDDLKADGKSIFFVYCYHIGHDGTSYGAVRRKFGIESFTGERDIQSLEVYPLRLAENRNELLETLQEQGRKTLYTFEQRHQAYNNWSLTTAIQQSSKRYSDRKEVSKMASRLFWLLNGYRQFLPSSDDELVEGSSVAAEFIESHVIVDLEEAFRANPGWRPRFHKPNISKAEPVETKEEDWKIQVWSDKSRSKLILSIPELVQRQDGTEIRQRHDNIRNNDPFLYYRADGLTRREKKSQGREPNKLHREDLVLLPRHSLAYTLRDRKFVVIDVNHLKPIIQDKGVFKNLKIRKEYKDIIRGLVSSHFQRKDLERHFTDKSSEALGQDLIQGKGKGLVILLHGAPGVGKTATAETVAMEMNKPLFTITCGDLGLKASEVESSLTNIFRLAQKWDCVLLLDEADVFLSQRSRFDMKRNALVSVFLRVLEYYNGLLFLTTNRVGTIDEAFKSRIQMSLYYPPLTAVQTIEIFKLNVEKLHSVEQQRFFLTGNPKLVIKRDEILEFADNHFKSTDSANCWNGRQIRNAFQIASGLAYYHFSVAVDEAQRNGKEPPSAPVLDRNLFEKVQLATLNFNKYMLETQGVDDAERAHRVGERADHYRDNRPPPPSSAYAPDPRQGNFDVSGSFGVPPTASSSQGNYGGPFAAPGQTYPASHLAGGGQTAHSNAPQYPFTPAEPQGPSYQSLHHSNTSSRYSHLVPYGDAATSIQSTWPPQTPNQRQQAQVGASLGHERFSPTSAASTGFPGYNVPSTRFQDPSMMDEEESYD